MASKVTLAQALTRAASAYNAGKLEEAEQLCQQIIVAKNDCFDAFHLLGLVHSRLNGQQKALASYDRALTVLPSHAETLASRGQVLHALKRFKEALASYDCAVAVEPSYAAASLGRGIILHELGRFEEALASYDHVLALRPDHPETLSNRGFTLHKLNQFDEALVSCDRALAARPDYAEALSNRGNTLHELKRFDEALASCDLALEMQPSYPEVLYNRGNTLQRLNRLEEALASCSRALASRPIYAKALSTRGNILDQLGRFEEALAGFDRALIVRPDDAELHHNRAVVLRELGRFHEVLTNCDHAIALRPDHPDTHVQEAFCLLRTGEFDRGWKKYEWRWDSGQSGEGRNFERPLWLGSNDIVGKTILLHAEQGLGDTMQFCRYVPLVAQRGARVILEVQPQLRELMTTLTGVSQITCRGELLPCFDTHCPLLSLPLAFGTRLETIPSATPYLRAAPQTMSKWSSRLSPTRGPRIGLAWSGNPMNKNDHNRSMPLSSLLPLLDVDAQFVSLQYDVRAEDALVLKDRADVLHFGDELRGFCEPAALISNLDLVITVCTSVAHLTGALAKPVWVMLPFVPDWRWLAYREDSPWYPTARLFRQDKSRRWDNVIARVRAALQDFAKPRR